MTDWRAVDRQLRARPGHWALVATKKSKDNAARVASLLRLGDRLPDGSRYAPLELGAFEIERRDCEVYARYVGHQSEAVAS